MIPTLGFGLAVCVGILILVVIILLIAFFLSMLIEFLPATILAVLVFLIWGDLFLAVIVFLVVAFILSIVDRKR